MDVTPGGRRANGLPSADWGALLDVDPRLSEGLLDRLAAAGVAAYVEPAAPVDTVSRAVVLPPRPLDRLWVDPGRADAARTVVSGELAELTALLAEDEPGATAHGLVQPVPRTAARRVLAPPALPDPPVPPGRAGPEPTRPAAPPGPPAPPAVRSDDAALDDDAVFQQIVAGFALDSADPVPRWPASEELPAHERQQPLGDPPRRRRTDAVPPPAQPPAAQQPPLPDRVEPPALEPDDTQDDGHYVPPPPPPAPRVRLRTLTAALAVLLGLVVLFAPSLVGLYRGPEIVVLGMLVLAAGAGALVYWVRDSAPGSGPDDGAVV